MYTDIGAMPFVWRVASKCVCYNSKKSEIKTLFKVITYIQDRMNIHSNVCSCNKTNLIVISKSVLT